MTPSQHGCARVGFALVPFATALRQDSVTITGETDILPGSICIATITQGNGALALDWLAPMVGNIVQGVGFDIALRLANPAATRQGAVRVHWIWF